MRRFPGIAVALLIGLAACSGSSESASSTTAAGGATRPAPAASPAEPSSTVTPPSSVGSTTSTSTTTLPTLPDLAGDLVWFAPLPPLSTGPGRPFVGSEDFMELFQPEAEWDVAASHIDVFKLYGEWVAYGATDAELATAVASIRKRGMALAVEVGPLDADEGCGEGVESFAGTIEGNLIADRVQAAGGKIDLVALDEPYYFAGIYDGPNACGWSAEKVVAEVGDFIDVMRERFPGVVVGDTEPTPQPVQVATYLSWLETFREVNGYDLAFLHLDMDWSRTDWPFMVRDVVDAGQGLGVPIGIIYIGNGADPSDEVYISITGERVLRLEDSLGVMPSHVLFQSWVDHPDRVLPESEPFTFTWLIRAYFEDRDSLGFASGGAGANVAHDRPGRASRSKAGNEAAFAFDGDTGTLWSAGAGPSQWIEVDLDGPVDIVEIRLVVSQYPAGSTTHRILGSGPDTGGFVELGVLQGDTNDGDLLVLEADPVWFGLDTIRVETTSSPSWVAWRDIEVIAGG